MEHKEKGIIGYYYKSGKTKIFTENSRTYEKTHVATINNTAGSDEVKKEIERLSKLYPNYSRVEFKY